MKRMVFALALQLIYSFAFANAEEVPDDTLLTKLPLTARFLVTGTLDGRRMCGGRLDFAIGDSKGEGPYVYSCNPGLTGYGIGDSLQIYSVERERDPSKYVIRMRLRDGSTTNLFIERYRATNVQALKLHVAGKLALVYDDPYAGMDQGMMVDVLMAKITSKLKNNDFTGAVPEFAKLESLKGAKLPESFYYYYSQTLLMTGEKAKAQSYATEYLKIFGKKGKYYAEIIDIMGRL